MMVWYIFNLQKDFPHWVNTSLTLEYLSFTYLLFFVCVWEHKFYSIAANYSYTTKCQVSSPVVTMLYIRSSDLTHLITESLYPFISLYFAHPSLRQPPFYSVSVSLFFQTSHIRILCSIFLFLSGLFHLA